MSTAGGGPGNTGTVELVSVKPKSSCCQDRPRCKRCPIRLLAAGKLTSGDAKAIFSTSRNKKALKKAGITKKDLPIR